MKKLEKIIKRPQSVVTGEGNLEHLYTLKDFPVFFGCVESSSSEDLCADMKWAIDPDSGVVQLTELIPLEILYQSQHVDGCGPTWKKYYEEFSKYVNKQKRGRVLEIGGGQGQLAEITTGDNKDIEWIILEPNPTHPGSKKIRIIKGFFDKNFRFDEKVDAVVFSQLLEHIYEPKEFLKTINDYLEGNGLLTFAYPNLELWLKRKYTNAINFEHTMFLTDHHVDYLLKRVGFDIIDKTKYKDHSYFYTAKKTSKYERVNLENKYKEYLKIFNDFIEYHKRMVNELNKKIENSKSPVYCFGAHIFTTYLLAFGLNSKKIVSLLDNSHTKQDKRLYGTNLKVESPKVLAGKGKVNLILKAGIYNDEIKKDISENVNPNISYW